MVFLSYKAHIFDTFRLIVREYMELKKFFLIRNSYQLIGWEREETQVIVMLRVCGTLNIFYSSPEQILQDDYFVNGLIGSDVRLIASLLKEDNKFSARYQLISQSIDVTTKEVTFIIYDALNKSKERIDLLSIQKDKTLLENMSGLDGQIVGFMAAQSVEKMTQEFLYKNL